MTGSRMRFLLAAVWLVSAIRRLCRTWGGWLGEMTRRRQRYRQGPDVMGLSLGEIPSWDWAQSGGTKGSGGYTACDWLNVGLDSLRWYFHLDPGARSRLCGGGGGKPD